MKRNKINKNEIPQLGSQELPLALPLKSLLGPSFILLGLGLGSGEVVLWPYMASNYGLGIMWGLLLGITMQFFINMEVSRYALVNGESVFVGFARLFRWLPIWFILSTFLGFGWPGIGLYGASLLSAAAHCLCRSADHNSHHPIFHNRHSPLRRKSPL